jgi:menaquinone-dependent protoporphyrinogen IX oxidase
MKTGIIIHSNTNNTLSVGERLLETLRSKGADACLERVTAVNEDTKSPGEVRLASAPEVGSYDMIIIGAPVHGFSLSKVMTAYLKQLPGLQGKRVACFVTEHFPKPWMGGSKTVRQTARLITDHGGTVTQTAVVNWTSKAREEQISKLVAAFTADVIGG